MATSKGCLPAAVKLLATRDHSERELRTKLARRFAAADIDTALDTLRTRGYLDDAGLAARLASQLQGTGKYGLNGIKARLNARGFPAAAIAAALAALDKADECPRALALARRQFPAPERGDAPRIGRFLAGRGFASAAIVRVLETLCGYEENG